MGLFSNNKKLCPICGSPTPRLLATKVEDTPICKECAGKIDLPDGMLAQMSLEAFRQYLAYYEENQSLRDLFAETNRMDFGFLESDLLADTTHRLLRLTNYNGSLVFPSSALKHFRFTEDGKTLFESGAGGLHCFRSDVPERVHELQPYIDRFYFQKEEFRRMERMEEMRDRRDRRPGEPDDRPYIPEPSFDMPAPVRRFAVELTLDDPYWKSFRKEIKAPGISSIEPDIGDYLRDYDAKVAALYDMAFALAQIMDPAARAIWDDETEAAQQPAAPAVDTVTELQRYKQLLDTGVITAEEFSAKKKQLLGI